MSSNTILCSACKELIEWRIMAFALVFLSDKKMAVQDLSLIQIYFFQIKIAEDDAKQAEERAENLSIKVL